MDEQEHCPPDNYDLRLLLFLRCEDDSVMDPLTDPPTEPLFDSTRQRLARIKKTTKNHLIFTNFTIFLSILSATIILLQPNDTKMLTQLRSTEY